MNKVTVSYGQTWLDIAMQELGDIERTMELVQLNNRALSNELEAGEVLLVPGFDSKKRSIIQLFRNAANKPASAYTPVAAEQPDQPDQPDPIDEGIGRWAIENDFVLF
jgi:hypothetical protein